MTTQADTLTASLAEIGPGGNGTIVSLILRKKGVVRVSPDPTKRQRVVYGDDLVHVLLWTGFKYRALAERSHKKLHELWASGHLVGDLVKEAHAEGYTNVTIADASRAVHEMSDALRLASHDAPNPEEVEDVIPEEEKSIWEPLTVNGQLVTGAKVYRGPGNTNDPRAPKPGTIYIDGVKLGEAILDPAANGPWRTQHKPGTVVKNLLREKLPSGLYVRYSLDADRLIAAKVGKAASESAKRGGVSVDPEALRSLFKIAA